MKMCTYWTLGQTWKKNFLIIISLSLLKENNKKGRYFLNEIPQNQVLNLV